MVEGLKREKSMEASKEWNNFFIQKLDLKMNFQ